MTEEPKVSDFIEDKPSLPEACADTMSAVKEAVPGTESALGEEEIERLTNDLIAAIKTVYDPEIPVDIYELGLIYKIDVDDDRNVAIEMTLTASCCSVAGDIPIRLQNAAMTAAGASDVNVDLAFDPPWEPSWLSEEALSFPT